MAVVNELVTKFSFEGSTKPLQDYNKSFGEATKLLAASVGVITAATAAFGGFIAATLSGADAQVQLAIDTGVSIESIQELGFAASVTGSSAEALESSIIGLSERIGEAAQKGSEDFNRLGISVRDSNGQIKDSAAVLDEVRQRFNALNLSQAERISFAQKLGIDKSLVQLLSLSGNELDNLRKKASALGIVTTEQADQIASFNDSLTVLRFGFDALQKNIAIGFAPQLRALAEDFTDFLMANRELITEGITKTIDIIGGLVSAVVNVAGVIDSVIENTVGWKVSIGALTSAWVFFNRALLLSPVGIIVGAITVLILLIDDLIVAFRGGESVIGNFFNVKIAGNAIVRMINDTINALSKLINYIKSFFSDINIGGIFNSLFGSPGTQREQLAAMRSQSSQNNNVNIEIKTDNPQLAGQSVEQSLGRVFDQANTQFKRGGR